MANQNLIVKAIGQKSSCIFPFFVCSIVSDFSNCNLYQQQNMQSSFWLCITCIVCVAYPNAIIFRCENYFRKSCWFRDFRLVFFRLILALFVLFAIPIVMVYTLIHWLILVPPLPAHPIILLIWNTTIESELFLISLILHPFLICPNTFHFSFVRFTPYCREQCIFNRLLLSWAIKFSSTNLFSSVSKHMDGNTLSICFITQ